MTRTLALLTAAALATLAGCSPGTPSPAATDASTSATTAASGSLTTIGAKCGLSGGAIAQDGNSALAGSHDQAACMVQQLGAPATVTTAMQQSTSKGEQTWPGGSVRWNRDGDWGRYAVALPGAKLPDVEDSSASATAAGAATSPTERRFGSVVELRDAAVAAGHACPSWVQDNIVKLAAESGRCGEDDVFSTYATSSALDEAVATLKSMNGMFTDPAMRPAHLVGPNWIIGAKDVAQLRAQLGGTIVR